MTDEHGRAGPDDPNRLTVRRATGGDTRALLELWRELDTQHRRALPDLFGDMAGPSPTLDFLLEAIDGRDRAIFVAERDGRILGLTYVLTITAPDHPLLVPRTYAVIDDVVVSARARHQGVGRALTQAAEAWARDLGVNQFEAEAYEFNDAAKAFYASLGYEAVSRIMFKQD